MLDLLILRFFVLIWVCESLQVRQERYQGVVYPRVAALSDFPFRILDLLIFLVLFDFVRMYVGVKR